MTPRKKDIMAIKTDALALFWEPLTSVGTETYAIKADDCQLFENFGWRDIVVKVYDT